VFEERQRGRYVPKAWKGRRGPGNLTAAAPFSPKQRFDASHARLCVSPQEPSKFRSGFRARRSQFMGTILKFFGGAVGIIFLIGLLVVIGLFALIF
jgi:hypothetical protein